MARAIGIDLGTTYTVVATIEGGRPKIVPNAEGQHLTPSVVGFTSEGTLLVGQPAKCQAAVNPDRTVFSIKRRMGSDYKVRIAQKEFSPQELSSLILRKAKADAEEYLGERIDQAVITVPAYFNDRQRQATRQAGLLAGLDVMRIINEPTAAALAYGLGAEDVHTILVWDLGGGTFDVSILDLGEGIFEVRAVSGDTSLGGDDYDSRLMSYLAEVFKKIQRVAFPEEAGAWRRLREEAERAKIALSLSSATRVKMPVSPDAAAAQSLELELTRERLEGLTADLLQRMVIPTRQALGDAGLAPQDIDRVILAGGATRMPAVRALAREMFSQEPYRYLNPDEVVALGAAIQSGMLLGLIEKVFLLDVLPLSLGVETLGGLTARIIPRNAPLPAAETRIFTTAVDNQTSMDIHVLQGERELAADNISLGQFQLHGIPTAPRGAPKVEVAFEADVDGIIHVCATDLLSGNEVTVKVTSTKHLDPGEIENLAEQSRRNTEQDAQKRAQIEAGIAGNNLIAASEVALQELHDQGHDPQMERLAEAISQLTEALASGVSREIRHRSRCLQQVLQAVTAERPQERHTQVDKQEYRQ